MRTDPTHPINGAVDPDELERQIAEMYRSVANEGDEIFTSRRPAARVPRRAARPATARARQLFASVGHEFGLARLLPGERVLDLGSGSGMDAFAAAAQVGPHGSVTVSTSPPSASQREIYLADVAAAGFRLQLVQPNPGYHFTSVRAQQTSETYGAHSISLLALNPARVSSHPCNPDLGDRADVRASSFGGRFHQHHKDPGGLEMTVVTDTIRNGVDTEQKTGTTTIRYERRTTVDRPISDVFARLADLDGYGTWMHRTGLFRRSGPTSDGPLGPGTAYLDATRMGTFRGQITDYQPPSRIGFRETLRCFGSDLMEARPEYFLEADRDRTIVHHVAEGELFGLMRLMKPVAALLARSERTRTVESLRRSLESG